MPSLSPGVSGALERLADGVRPRGGGAAARVEALADRIEASLPRIMASRQDA
jgi:hypothetical protein